VYRKVASVKKPANSPATRSRVFLVLEVVHIQERDAQRVEMLVSSAQRDEVLKHSWPLQSGVLWDSQVNDIIAEAGQYIAQQCIDFVGVQAVLEI
jgi:hypothetical protein